MNTLVWSLDDVAWSLQEAVDKGAASQLDYVRAFRRARAANRLLDLLENRYDSAVYEACSGAQRQRRCRAAVVGATGLTAALPLAAQRVLMIS